MNETSMEPETCNPYLVTKSKKHTLRAIIRDEYGHFINVIFD
jgi:hypothetical protein